MSNNREASGTPCRRDTSHSQDCPCPELRREPPGKNFPTGKLHCPASPCPWKTGRNSRPCAPSDAAERTAPGNRPENGHSPPVSIDRWTGREPPPAERTPARWGVIHLEENFKEGGNEHQLRAFRHGRPGAVAQRQFHRFLLRGKGHQFRVRRFSHLGSGHHGLVKHQLKRLPFFQMGRRGRRIAHRSVGNGWKNTANSKKQPIAKEQVFMGGG